MKDDAPFNIQDGVGLIVNNVDKHVCLSVIHPALLVHMKLDEKEKKVFNIQVTHQKPKEQSLKRDIKPVCRLN